MVGIFTGIGLRRHPASPTNRPTIASIRAYGNVRRELKVFNQVMSEIIRRYKGASIDACLVAMRPIYDESQRLVPVLTRALRLSGYMQVTASPTGSGRRVVEVGYAPRGNPEYAVTVHEATHYQHEPPTQAKFLEQAIQNNARRSIERIRDYLADPRTVPNPKSLQVMPRYIAKNDLKTERGRRMRAERMAEGLDRPLEDMMGEFDEYGRSRGQNMTSRMYPFDGETATAGRLEVKRQSHKFYVLRRRGPGDPSLGFQDLHRVRVHRRFNKNKELVPGQEKRLLKTLEIRRSNERKGALIDQSIRRYERKKIRQQDEERRERTIEVEVVRIYREDNRHSSGS